MNVPNIGQGPGSVATLPGPQTGGATPTARWPEPAAAFTRVAWFDLNGDGHIENRNPVDGGDGTLIVPANAVDVPTYSRSARHSESRSGNVGSPAGTVTTQRVIDAYQRDGGQAAVASAPKERAVA